MRLKSAVLIDALKVAITQLRTTMSAADYQGLKVKVESGNFILFASLLDNLHVKDGIGAEDGFVFEFFKALTDSAAAAENATFHFFKALSDVADISDDEIFSFFKALADPVGVSDPISKHVAKSTVADGFAVLDDDVLNTGKVFFETPSAAEQINTKAFGKNVEDVPSVAEQITRKTFTKLLADDGFVQEAYSSEVGKPFTDSATFDDSDLRLFGKNELETITFDDLDVFAVDKVLEELPTALDQYASSYNKPFNELVSFTDDVDGTASLLDDQEMQFTKVKTDAASLTDSFFRLVAFDRDFTETPVARETHAFGFGRPLADTLAALETHAFDAGKPLAETPAASDAFVYAAGKPLTDTFLGTEQIAKAFAKAPFADSSSVTDTDLIQFGKVPSDLASLTDAGSLRSQGYCDFTYFAEDYVGASRTFT